MAQLLIGCTEKPTPPPEINLIPLETWDEPGIALREYYVIANPPRTNDDLKELVKNYHLQHLTKEMIKNYQYVHRSFYLQTEDLTKDFVPKDSGFFTSRSISHFHDQLLIQIKTITEHKEIWYHIWAFKISEDYQDGYCAEYGRFSVAFPFDESGTIPPPKIYKEGLAHEDDERYTRCKGKDVNTD